MGIEEEIHAHLLQDDCLILQAEAHESEHEKQKWYTSSTPKKLKHTAWTPTTFASVSAGWKGKLVNNDMLLPKAMLLFVLGIFLSVTNSRQVSAQSEISSSLSSLIVSLSDGPIQARPAVLPKGSVSAQAAAQSACKAVGISFQAARAWPVTFTDRENLSRPTPELPSWLVASSRPFVLPLVDESAPSGVPRAETVYAVVNARTGTFSEAFNKPRAAWWRRVRVTNKAFLSQLNKNQETAFPALVPPRLPLSGPFPSSRSVQHRDIAAYFGGRTRADQFIARYFVYTDLSSEVPTHLASGPQYQFAFLHQPVWCVSLEGLNTPIGGPVRVSAPPMPPHEPGSVSIPRSEEANTTIDSTTGESFSLDFGRAGRQVDKF